MTNWTAATILALAPDSSSASSGKGLSQRKHWLTVARQGDILWGECQGSGKHPYQTRLDATAAEPVFKCTCPSRKFPCKHGLGLFLLFASSPDQFAETAPPTWVAEWLEGRAGRAEKKAEKAVEDATKPPDPKAAEKRSAARDKKVRAGLEELALWTSDLVRGGIAGVQSKGYAHWEAMAARLVDAQAPTLARAVRDIPNILTRNDWQARLLEELGSLHLTIQAYGRLETLPEAVQADVRGAIGYPVSTEDVLALPSVTDTWQVIAQSIEALERIRARRTWLRGSATQTSALLLEFGVPQAPLSAGYAVGSSVNGALHFYPSNAPQRAIFGGEATPAGQISVTTGSSIQSNFEQYAAALGRNPWLERTLFSLSDATLQPDGFVRDASGLSLAVDSRFTQSQLWHAVTGGHPAKLHGEWNGEAMLPLAVTLSGEHFNFAHLEDGA